MQKLWPRISVEVLIFSGVRRSTGRPSLTWLGAGIKANTRTSKQHAPQQAQHAESTGKLQMPLPLPNHIRGLRALVDGLLERLGVL